MFYSASTRGFYDKEIHEDAIPVDAVEISTEDYNALLDGQSEGKVIKPDADGHPVLVVPAPETEQELQEAFEAQIQVRLDSFARTRGYDGILSACSYASSSVLKFKTEGQYCVDARDATWAAAYAVLEEVKTGARPVPASIADIESDLPALEWPL